MKAQDYIISKLDELKKPLGLAVPPNGQLENEILRLILSKKFRKYAVNEPTIQQIKSAIHAAVSQNKPIQTTFIFGGYKLWRLDEAPEADFAELFALMYYAKWLQPICDIYEPGVWLDFFSDDVIVPIINNIPEADLRKYQDSFEQIINFLDSHKPKNLRVTFTRVGDQYENHQNFLNELEKNKQELSASLDGGLPILSNDIKNTLLLNVKPNPDQAKDEKWLEKILLTHDAYMLASRRRPYYNRPDKFNFLAGARVEGLAGRLLLGSTKNSIMKFWVGIGALRPKGDSFEMTVLSQSQLAKTKFNFEPVSLENLTSKNFSKIRVIKEQ
jgi:hypothetical protein